MTPLLYLQTILISLMMAAGVFIFVKNNMDLFSTDHKENEDSENQNNENHNKKAMLKITLNEDNTKPFLLMILTIFFIPYLNILVTGLFAYSTIKQAKAKRN